MIWLQYCNLRTFILLGGSNEWGRSSSNNPSGIQGICPSGWHVPSNAEWCELENYVEPGIDVNCNSTGYRGSMAKKLAAPQLWSSYSSNSFAPGYWHTDTTGFNTSGFSAIPGGRYRIYYYSSGSSSNSAYYTNLYTEGYWWSCTMSNDNMIFYRFLDYSNSGVNLTSILNTNRSTYYDYHYAHSVRCVKNWFIINYKHYECKKNNIILN